MIQDNNVVDEKNIIGLVEILTGAFVTIATTIIGVVGKHVLSSRKKQEEKMNEIKDLTKDVKTSVDDMSGKIDMNSRDIQRIQLYNNDLPIEERINAGEQYLTTETGQRDAASRVYFNNLMQRYIARIGNKEG
jgi:hypothetical protein